MEIKELKAASAEHEIVAEEDEEEEDVVLPGFRFHPTDEELAGFYLHRKVNKKGFSIEIIKEIDIYKYDPWDLPKVMTAGEKEWYFFCLRGRKYRNSIRPNRVTGSGFWKATGIDRPIYSTSNMTSTPDGDCIGLKKSLVYYCGSAGKGTKTDWMMHEFRLPTSSKNTSTAVEKASPSMQEAEIWTLCRILKRNMSYKKYPQSSWKPSTSKPNIIPTAESSSKSSSFESDHSCRNEHHRSSSSFATSASDPNAAEMSFISKDNFSYDYIHEAAEKNSQVYAGDQFWNSAVVLPADRADQPNKINDHFLIQETNNWDELGRIMEFITDQ